MALKAPPRRGLLFGAAKSQPWWNAIGNWRLVYNLVCCFGKEGAMNIEIGSYEAKTRLPELLRGIQAGRRYTITLRGQPIADLVPAGSSRANEAAAAVDEMRKLMWDSAPVQKVNLKALVDEGRA